MECVNKDGEMVTVLKRNMPKRKGEVYLEDSCDVEDTETVTSEVELSEGIANLCGVGSWMKFFFFLFF